MRGRPGRPAHAARVAARDRRSRSRTTTAATSCSDPTACSTSGIGDGGAAGDQGPGTRRAATASRSTRCSARSCASTPRRRWRTPYTIPPTTRSRRGGGRPEIWAYGLRNPWRFSFDRETGDLWIGDVGQDKYEEIDFMPAGQGAGANYGWNRLRGQPRVSRAPRRRRSSRPCSSYAHDDGYCAVIGGYVYRGTKIPDLRGAYLYSDNCNPKISAITRRGRARQRRSGTWESPCGRCRRSARTPPASSTCSHSPTGCSGSTPPSHDTEPAAPARLRWPNPTRSVARGRGRRRRVTRRRTPSSGASRASYRGHTPMPSWLGSPVRANAAQAVRRFVPSRSARASVPTTAPQPSRSNVPNVNGTSVACAAPRPGELPVEAVHERIGVVPCLRVGDRERGNAHHRVGPYALPDVAGCRTRAQRVQVEVDGLLGVDRRGVAGQAADAPHELRVARARPSSGRGRGGARRGSSRSRGRRARHARRGSASTGEPSTTSPSSTGWNGIMPGRRPSSPRTPRPARRAARRPATPAGDRRRRRPSRDARGTPGSRARPRRLRAPSARSSGSSPRRNASPRRGDASSWRIEPAPADSPNTVTRSGSPPNAAAFVRTQASAANWSRSPQLVAAPRSSAARLGPRAMKPSAPSR